MTKVDRFAGVRFRAPVPPLSSQLRDSACVTTRRHGNSGGYGAKVIATPRDELEGSYVARGAGSNVTNSLAAVEKRTKGYGPMPEARTRAPCFSRFAPQSHGPIAE